MFVRSKILATTEKAMLKRIVYMKFYEAIKEKSEAKSDS